MTQRDHLDHRLPPEVRADLQLHDASPGTSTNIAHGISG